jgi:tRNA pseudouridine38-40 synthase
MSRRYALKFGYDGKMFFGYARQPDVTTVEGEIVKALLATGIIKDVKGSELISASRTDKGVSARGNVLALNTDFRKDEILGALNAHLKDIWFYGIAEAQENFNPRHALGRWYRYLLFSHEIDNKDIERVASVFQGTHDFTSFSRPEGKNPVRTIDAIEVQRKGDFLYMDFRAKSFLWHMVRRIVSAIVQVVEQQITIDELIHALEGKGDYDFGLVEAESLILMDVLYDLDFEIQDNNLERVKNSLEESVYTLKRDLEIYGQLMDI